MAIGRPISFATSRTIAIVAACCSWVPCEKLDSGDVQARIDETAKGVARRTRGAQRANDLCSTVAQKSPSEMSFLYE